MIHLKCLIGNHDWMLLGEDEDQVWIYCHRDDCYTSKRLPKVRKASKTYKETTV